MRLIFLYTEDFGPLQGRELNFVSDHDIHIFDSTLIDNGGEILPKGFFNVRGKNAKPVDAVSAVIGENGTGKTSVVEYLRMILLEFKSTHRFILVYEVNGKLYFVQKGLEEIKLSIKGAIQVKGLEKFTSSNYAKKFFRLVYLSPCYSLANRFLNKKSDRFFDLSTSGLMHRLYESLSKPALSTADFVSPMELLLADESAKMMAIIHRLSKDDETKKELEDIGVRTPLGVRLKLNDRTFECDSKMILGDVWRASDKSAYIRCFLMFAFAFIKDARIRCQDPRKETARNAIANKLLQVCKRIRKSGDISADIDEIEKLLGDTAIDKRGFLDGARRFFGVLYRLLVEEPELFAQRILFKRKNSLPIQGITQLISLYVRTVRNADFLEVAFDPVMSAGEMASLSLWARLYSYLEEREEHKAGRLVLFVDEAETTLHPQWQKNLIRNLIWFFDKMAPKLHIHIILASHSPVLLSDVPGGNVCCLSRSNGDIPIHGEMGSGIGRTFASNIYDLFRSQFFVKDGPVGSFAQMKIDGVFDRIHSEESIDEDILRDDMKIVSLIGDEPVRRYLMQALEMRNPLR